MDCQHALTTAPADPADRAKVGNIDASVSRRHLPKGSSRDKLISAKIEIVLTLGRSNLHTDVATIMKSLNYAPRLSETWSILYHTGIRAQTVFQCLQPALNRGQPAIYAVQFRPKGPNIIPDGRNTRLHVGNSVLIRPHSMSGFPAVQPQTSNRNQHCTKNTQNRLERH